MQVYRMRQLLFCACQGKSVAVDGSLAAMRVTALVTTAIIRLISTGTPELELLVAVAPQVPRIDAARVRCRSERRNRGRREAGLASPRMRMPPTIGESWPRYHCAEAGSAVPASAPAVANAKMVFRHVGIRSAIGTIMAEWMGAVACGL